MNKLLIAIGIIFLICTIVGMVRGFIKIAVSLIVTILVIAFVTFLTPYMSTWIRKITPLESSIQEKCVEMSGLDAGEMELPVFEIPREKQKEIIEKVDIPESFRKLLLENNNSESYRELGVTTFGEYIGSYLAKMIADAVAFLLILLIMSLISHSILYIFGIIENLPIVGGMNKIAGGALGFMAGLIIVWVLFIVITLLYSTGIGKICFEYIQDSRLLTFLYENNILLNIATKF